MASNNPVEILVSFLVKVAAVSLLVGSIIFGFGGLTTIKPGEVGIKIKMVGSDRGMQQDTLGTGLRWVNPITYDIEVYDTRRKQYIQELEDMPSQTKDGQPVLVDLSLEIGLEGNNVPNLHTTIGPDWYNQVVYPNVRSAVRNIVPSQSSDEVYTNVGRMAIQNGIQKELKTKLAETGIDVIVNMRAIDFTNGDFIAVLEKKAIAAQNVEIENRNALAAEKSAIKMANIAEGEKQKVIKEAEAEREKQRMDGEGKRLQKEEDAKGILAIAKAEAEGTRLKREAYAGAGGAELVQIAWAENLGPNVKVYGFPTGAPGTNSFMDINGLMQNAFKTVAPAAAPAVAK